MVAWQNEERSFLGVSLPAELASAKSVSAAYEAAAVLAVTSAERIKSHYVLQPITGRWRGPESESEEEEEEAEAVEEQGGAAALRSAWRGTHTKF